MSCNACRVLRKGCSDTCILRPCLRSIDSAQSQGHATLFLAKFFGRASLISFISAVPEIQRPALFQSLLFEAAGRTVNPVNGAVGLLWTGNWHVCQAAVETVLRGGALRPIAEFLGGESESHDASECTNMVFKLQDPGMGSGLKLQKLRRLPDEQTKVKPALADLDLGLTPVFSVKKRNRKLGTGSRSMNSEESLTTTCGDEPETQIKLLKLF